MNDGSKPAVVHSLKKLLTIGNIHASASKSASSVTVMHRICLYISHGLRVLRENDYESRDGLRSQLTETQQM